MFHVKHSTQPSGRAESSPNINKRSTGKLGSRWSVYRNMVGPNGFEPATSRLSGVRSNQLSYGPLKSAQLLYLKPKHGVKDFFRFIFPISTQNAQGAQGDPWSTP